ncbi:glycosyl hydrolase [Streptomyces fumanus]|nr:glycosyl hydrolase [Streptomyces fumanus]
MVLVGATTTTAVLLDRHDDTARLNGAPAADVGGRDHTITLQNKTDSRIWVGSRVNQDGSAALTGLPTLDPGQSATITVPEHQGAGHWRGTFFARQGCSGEEGSTFHCAVGDCGPYADHCSTGQQPTSLAEFNFDPADKLAPWYDVSYVDAVSTAVTITPDGTTPPAEGECAVAGCAVDLLASCPPENLTKDAATGKPLVCVNPNRDAKTAYSEAVSQKCPTAYAWSKHDAEPGNRTMYQCTKCTGLTIAFHGSGAAPGPAPTTAPNPDPTAPAAGRKGVSLNPFDGAPQALADSGVSWYFNWASSSSGVTPPQGVEYVPMIWGPGSVTDEQLASAKREGTTLLGFNEPDLASQANMTPEQALDLWPRLQDTGLRLGAPAVSQGADVPGGWLDRFMQGAAERGLRVDFIPVHWYGADFGPDATRQLREYLERVHERYHKPVWLTEYGLIDFSQGTPRYPSQQQEADFIKASTQMLDGLGYLERYAWFTLSTHTSPTGLYDGTAPNTAGQAYREAH